MTEELIVVRRICNTTVSSASIVQHVRKTCIERRDEQFGQSRRVGVRVRRVVFLANTRDELDEPAVPGRLRPASGVHAAAAYGLPAPDAADADAGASSSSHRVTTQPSHALTPREQAQRTGFQPQMSMQVRTLPLRPA